MGLLHQVWHGLKSQGRILWRQPGGESSFFLVGSEAGKQQEQLPSPALGRTLRTWSKVCFPESRPRCCLLRTQVKASPRAVLPDLLPHRQKELGGKEEGTCGLVKSGMDSRYLSGGVSLDPSDKCVTARSLVFIHPREDWKTQPVHTSTLFIGTISDLPC